MLTERQARRLLPYGAGWCLDLIERDVTKVWTEASVVEWGSTLARVRDPQGYTLRVDLDAGGAAGRIKRFVRGIRDGAVTPVHSRPSRPPECEAANALEEKREGSPSADRRALKSVSKKELVEAYTALKRGEPDPLSIRPSDWESFGGGPPSGDRWMNDYIAEGSPCITTRIPYHGARGGGFKKGEILEVHGDGYDGLRRVEVLGVTGVDSGTLTVRYLEEPAGDRLDNRTIINDCEATTGWTGDDSGPSGQDGLLWVKGKLAFGDGGGEPTIGDAPAGSKGITIFTKGDEEQVFGVYGPAADHFEWAVGEAPPDLQSQTVTNLPAGDLFMIDCPHCELGWINMLIFRKKCSKCGGTGAIDA